MEFHSRTLSPDIRLYAVLNPSKFFHFIEYILYSVTILLLVLLRNNLFWICFLVFLSLKIIYRRNQVKEETLMAIRELGVQLSTKYYSGLETHLFIDKKKIKSLIINEGIHFHAIIFYLAFIVEGQSKMILAFQNMLPKLKDLLPIYRGTRCIIFEEPE